MMWDSWCSTEDHMLGRTNVKSDNEALVHRLICRGAEGSGSLILMSRASSRPSTRCRLLMPSPRQVGKAPRNTQRDAKNEDEIFRVYQRISRALVPPQKIGKRPPPHFRYSGGRRKCGPHAKPKTIYCAQPDLL